MQWIPQKFMDTLPEQVKKLLESPENKFAKVVLVVSDGNYTEVFHCVPTDAEANMMLDHAKNRVLQGLSNGKGKGACFD